MEQKVLKKESSLENNEMIKKVIEKLGTQFGFTHKITEQSDTVTILFFSEDKSPYGEVILKKKNMSIK